MAIIYKTEHLIEAHILYKLHHYNYNNVSELEQDLQQLIFVQHTQEKLQNAIQVTKLLTPSIESLTRVTL